MCHDSYLLSSPATLQALDRMEYESVLFIGTRFSNLYTAVDTRWLTQQYPLM
jgi:hypothetical protein